MDTHEIINGCIKVESAASSIYGKLMQLFPDEQDFWEGLHNDEKDHISFLNDVKSLGLSDEVQKMDLLPSKSMVKEAVKLATSINKKIHHNPVTLKQALDLTLKLEESMVETYTNELIASLLSCDNPASYNTFLKTEKDHKSKIIRKIKQEG